jgi:cell division protein ZapA
MSAQTRVVHVDIQGQRYAIRSALDPKYVADIAAFVDQRLDLAGREVSTTDSLRIAVLAALNIADELFRARSETSDGKLQLRAAELERMVDAALDAAGAKSRAAR